MRAIVMSRVGGPEVLEEARLPDPVPGAGEILVRIKACGVNPIDTKLRGRGLYFGEPPAILGCDGAGVVEAVGPGVERFAPGDRVFYCYGGLGQTTGNYAELAAVPEAYCAHLPDSVDWITAAATPLVLITAWESLFDRARIRKGQRVFIHAGAGGVGHVAVQLAAAAGCRVATTVGGPAKAELARSLGAELVIDRHREDLGARLREWTEGEGVDVALDTVGGAAFAQLVPLVRVYGDLVTLLQVPEDTDWKTLRLRNIRLSQELMLTPMVLGLDEAARHHAEILAEGARRLSEGRLTVHVSDVLPLGEAMEAHRRIEEGHMTGKLVLKVAD